MTPRIGSGVKKFPSKLFFQTLDSFVVEISIIVNFLTVRFIAFLIVLKGLRMILFYPQKLFPIAKCK